MSGYYLAMLNFGLVLGLAASGWLAVRFMQPALGIGVFTALSLAALVADIVFHETPAPPSRPGAEAQKTAGRHGGQEFRDVAALVISHGRLMVFCDHPCRHHRRHRLALPGIFR